MSQDPQQGNNQINDSANSDIMNRSLMYELCTNAYPIDGNNQEENKDDLIPNQFRVQKNKQYGFCTRVCENKEIPFGLCCCDPIFACYKPPIDSFNTGTGIGTVQIRRNYTPQQCPGCQLCCQQWISCLCDNNQFFTNVPLVPMVLFSSLQGDLQIHGKNVNAGFVFYKKKFIGNIEQNQPRYPEYAPITKHCGMVPMILINDVNKVQYTMTYEKNSTANFFMSCCLPCLYLERKILVQKDQITEFSINLKRSVNDILFVCCNNLFNEAWPTYDVNFPDNYSTEKKILLLAALLFFLELDSHFF